MVQRIRNRRNHTLIESLESRVMMSVSHMHVPGSVMPSLGKRPVVSLKLGGKSTDVSGVNIGAPSNLAANSDVSSRVTLTWTPGANAIGYYIFRSSGGTYRQIAKVNNASSFTDTTVSGSTTYSYYLVGYKANSTSAPSNVANVTTPAAPVVIAPDAPTNLALSNVTSNSLTLAWTDMSNNESGFRVYRSTDGANFSAIASLGAGTVSFSDSGLASGTQYYYEVVAWNSGGEGWSSAASATTDVVIPSGDPVSITTRYGGELVIKGTGANDSIFVSQSGSTLTIVGNGTSTTVDAPTDGLFIYSFGGSDNITIDSSVTLRLTVATIDASATTINNGDANANIWMDSTDGFSGAGTTHKVSSFFQNVSKAIGINLADPTDSGSITRPNASLWGANPVAEDVNQGSVGDCYYLSSLAGFATSMPNKLLSLAADLGDGTYVVQYMRNGVSSFVRVDGDMAAGGFDGYAYAHPGANGSIWALVMEKAYAYFRSGANTYASLSSGWMGTVYSDFGIANTSVSLSTTTDNSFFSSMSNYLASGKAVTFGTFSSGTQLVSSHAYTLMSVTSINGVNYYTVRNPWGVAGDSLENSAGYATLTFAQMVANFQLGTAAV